MPSPATAAAAAASAPLHRRVCARQHLPPASRCFLPSRAVLNSARLFTAPAPLPIHAPRVPPTAARAASPDAAAARSPTSGGQMLVFVPPHPLIKHWVSVLRNEQTPCAIFSECASEWLSRSWIIGVIEPNRAVGINCDFTEQFFIIVIESAMAELGRLLIYEASRDWLPTITGEIETPVAVASVEFIDPREPILVVPILRAGLALAELASSVLPATKTYHLGLRRDEETLQPSIYLNNLPDKIPEGSRVLVVDPMLATGGTIVAAIDLLIERGVTSKQIKVVSAVAAPPALQKLNNKFPGLHVYTGIIDPEVNEKGFIIPGLGDAGDRSFAT
ncbi:uracil phosphoribosyltransferase-like [Panicum miliaceum]|uniref:uracil phosphoribosyltransferase n=1 Tax=Panicum miliaceum TaxID=4540 RepID=A0A3L6RC99_PANMI|nr:uracil phosphoribosyltransferase-like [Panicum miliaceum]